MGGTPSVPRDSSQRLKVIGAGYSRTGTTTMQLALEKLLDGPVMHGGTNILNREDGKLIPRRTLMRARQDMMNFVTTGALTQDYKPSRRNGSGPTSPKPAATSNKRASSSIN
jgi:hypothetical protein